VRDLKVTYPVARLDESAERVAPVDRAGVAGSNAPKLVMATHDRDLALAARSFGFEIRGV
jgi:hypothetical protein